MTTPMTKEALAELKPGLYAILYRDNWDGQGDTYHLLARLSDDGQWSADESGRELFEYEGDEILSVWTLGEDADVLAQLAAKDKSNAFLKAQLAQLANFNPDWDMLEAAQESLREHASELNAANQRIAELESRTITVTLPEPDCVSDFVLPVAVYTQETIIDCLASRRINIQIQGGE